MNPRLDSLLRFFTSHPAIGALATLCALISVPLSILMYVWTRENRELIYTVHHPRTVLAQRDHPAGLVCKYRGEFVGQADVVAAHISFRNAGKASIRPVNILEPIHLRISQPGRILDAQISELTRPLTGIQLGELTDDDRVALSWKILEQGDGGRIQVIYAGGPFEALDLVGTIEGQGNPRKQLFPGNPPVGLLIIPGAIIGTIIMGLGYLWRWYYLSTAPQAGEARAFRPDKGWVLRCFGGMLLTLGVTYVVLWCVVYMVL